MSRRPRYFDSAARSEPSPWQAEKLDSILVEMDTIVAQGGPVAGRRVHSSEDEGSSPSPATTQHPEPFVLWQQSGGDPVRYRELMVEHGHIVPVEPCAECGQTFRHRHDFLDPMRIIRTDVFGHDER